MVGPRPLPDPEPIAWASVVVTLLLAGVAGLVVGLFRTRRWTR
jgi:hypothetical protein